MIIIAKHPADHTRDFEEVCEDIERAYDLRNQLLPNVIGVARALLTKMEKAGFDHGDGLQALVEAFQKLDLAIPAFVCPRCEMRGKTALNCHCRGRGWFAKNQMAEYTLAQNRAELLKLGTKRNFAGVLTDMVKRHGGGDE